MRLFVALEIPAETRAALAGLIASLRPKCPSAKWVRAEAMHVTLKFIGHTAEENLPKICAALAGVRSPSPVQLQFRGLGFFPNDRRPRVFWSGVEVSTNAAEIAAEIDASLTHLAIGIEPETRPFTPHLTLARLNPDERRSSGATAQGVAALVNAIRDSAQADFGRLQTSEFHLFESKLKPTGAEYTRLQTFPFAQAAP